MHDEPQAVKGVIFDALHTVLCDPVGRSPRHEAARLLDLPTEQHIRNLIYTVSADHPGMDCQTFVDALVKRTKGYADAELSRRLKEIWCESNSHVQFQDDAIPVLTTLRQRGYRLALVSNCTPFTRVRLKELDAERYFDTIVLSCEAGLLKPDPRIFWQAVEGMELSPEDTCVVGDKIKTDILGGTLAGCQTVLLEPRNPSIISEAKLPLSGVITRLSDLLTLSSFAGQGIDHTRDGVPEPES